MNVIKQQFDANGIKGAVVASVQDRKIVIETEPMHIEELLAYADMDVANCVARVAALVVTYLIRNEAGSKIGGVL